MNLVDILKELRSREDMPQVSTDDLGDAIVKLQQKGIEVTEDAVMGSKLNTSQKEIDTDKVANIVDKLRGMRLSDMKPVIISSDNFIVDGHHRVEAVKFMGKEKHKIPCLRINLKRDDAIDVYKKVEREIGS